jgi:hypothetical protein
MKGTSIPAGPKVNYAAHVKAASMPIPGLLLRDGKAVGRQLCCRGIPVMCRLSDNGGGLKLTGVSINENPGNPFV